MESGERRSTRGWQIATWILIGLNLICLAATTVAWGIKPTWKMEWLAATWFSSLVVVCALIGAYAGLGNRRIGIPIFVIAIPILVYVMTRVTGNSAIKEFSTFIVGIAGTVAFTTTVLRAVFGELKVVTGTLTHEDALQFRIKDLLIWTTAVALFLGVGRYVWSQNVSNANDTLIAIFGLAIAIAITTVVCIWALFGKNLSSWKAATIVIIISASCGLIYSFYPSMQVHFTLVCFFSQSVLVVVMIAIRKQGYRFVKRDA